MNTNTNTNAILIRILVSFCLALAVAGDLKGAESGEDHRILKPESSRLLMRGMKVQKGGMKVMKPKKTKKDTGGTGVANTPYFGPH